MSDATKLVAEKRTEFGKGAARKIRRAGNIPAVMYGHGTAPVHVALPEAGRPALDRLGIRVARVLGRVAQDAGAVRRVVDPRLRLAALARLRGDGGDLRGDLVLGAGHGRDVTTPGGARDRMDFR